jgi:tRNA pseudouridine55 synthase
MDIKYNKEAFLNGQILLIDKPYKWSSFQLVNKIRWAIKKKFNIKKIKVGHAGTLDPLATGLMIICTGRKTKQIETFIGMKKHYSGVFRLGSTTASYDLETVPENPKNFEYLTKNDLEKVRAEFLGETEQKPPLYSAIKKDGQRLYKIARQGKTTEIKSRKVYVNSFYFNQIDLPDVGFSVSCSKGTYIRSLVHDVGTKLGCGAHLKSLSRTGIGINKLEEALTLECFLNDLDEKCES